MPPTLTIAGSQTHERTEDVDRSSASREHLPTLDGLRGLAILAVVAFHTAVVVSHDAPWAYHDTPPVYAWPMFAGSLGVDLFFVLSGFLVLRSWRSIRERYADAGVRSIVEFARRRARRILPPYWFALAILIVWRAPEWLATAHGWRNIAMFVSLNQFLDPALPHELNTVTWSLTTETHFYVLAPMLAAAWVRFGWRTTLGLVIALSIGWRLLAGGTGDSAEWILGRADQFAAGMAAAALVAEHRAGRSARLLRWLTGRRAGLVLGGGLACLALAHGALRLQPKPLPFLVALHPLAGVMMAGLLVRGLCRGPGSMGALGNPVLRWIGLVSYSLYLWHWPFLAEASARWGARGPVVAGALGAAVGVAVLSYVVLERPFTRPALGRRRSYGYRWVGNRTEATIAISP